MLYQHSYEACSEVADADGPIGSKKMKLHDKKKCKRMLYHKTYRFGDTCNDLRSCSEQKSSSNAHKDSIICYQITNLPIAIMRRMITIILEWKGGTGQ